MMKSGGIKQSFTLIELMLVIGIIAIIAAIAIPNLLEARKSTNEVAAIGTLKTIMNGQALFREADREHDGNIDYGTIQELATANLIDSILGTGTRSGYLFETNGASNNIYNFFYIYANPRMLNGTGNRAYATNQEGVIYFTQQQLIAGGITLLVDDAVIPSGVHPIR